MTLYDEVGLLADASPEEVRETYHALARLLHPDQQRDPKLRALAERQMRRVNWVFETLGDARKRADYDQSLGQAQARAPHGVAPVIASPGIGFGGHFAWIKLFPGGLAGAGTLFGAVVGAACALWLGSSGPVVTPRRDAPTADLSSARTAPPRRSNATDVGKHSRRRQRLSTGKGKEISGAGIQAAESFPDFTGFASGSVQAVGPTQTAAAEPPPLASAANPGLPTELALPPPSHGGNASENHKESLAGTWVWVRSAKTRGAGDSYAPEFIEMVIREGGGLRRGRYRARYIVTNRAISPDVQFEFEGRGSRLEWSGNGGAAGELQLQPKSPGLMEIHWFTTTSGGVPVLTSGSAILVRTETIGER